jgi:hypothetical protein
VLGSGDISITYPLYVKKYMPEREPGCENDVYFYIPVFFTKKKDSF